MQLKMDGDVQAVAEYMQSNIPAARLVGVAAGIAAIAPLLWGRYSPEQVNPVWLSPGDLLRQLDANGSRLGPENVDDGSAAVADDPA
jgi:hypothetical protein